MPVKPKASTLLTQKRFWRIVEASLGRTDGKGLTWERQIEFLLPALGSLSDKELFGFDFLESKFFFQASCQKLWAVAYIVMGGCSDDAFMDFRTWLVYRGQPVFKAALKNHESLVEEFEKIPAGEIPLWDQKRPAAMVYDSRHGDGSFKDAAENFEFDYERPPEIKCEWDGEDEDSLRKLCPKTFARYWGNTRF